MLRCDADSPERIRTQESDQRIELSDSVLQWRTGETPFVLGIQGESCLGSIRRSLLDVVRFVEDDPVMLVDDLISDGH